jgi:transcription initiation factor TFIIH subunit 1
MHIDLQQTPATAAKASIKIVVQKSPDQSEAYTFTFTSAAARDDQQALTSALRKWIETLKVQAVATPGVTPQADGAATSVTIPTAHASVGAGTPKDDAYDDARLLADIELQRSLLNSSPALRQRFDQAVRDKPDTITLGQLSNQFWATRVHLLRSHAAEKAQGAGTYNVLSVVKPKNEGGQFRLNMSKEQIQLIFAQHPLVKKVYNENVPGMSEADFWSRFFNSRLVKKLRGEKITDVDPTDPKLDKYLNLDDSADSTAQLVMPLVPHFLDVEGNEQNHSQRLGNRPDLTMRPNTHDKVPILRVLNRMSEKMMADVPPSDTSRHQPAGVDEETYKELQLRDLQRAVDDNRIVLKVQDQSQFFSAGQGVHTSSSAATYAKRTPTQVLAIMQQEFRDIPIAHGQNGGIDLQAAIGVKDESSSDEEVVVQNKRRVGSTSSRTAATVQITKAIKKRHLQGDDYLSSQVTPSNEQAIKLGLSEQVFDNLIMTHNTTVEFLHYFWAVYYSGDSERASEVAKLIETLDKSLDRIKAVADLAESERTSEVEKTKREIENVTQRTGKRKKFDPNSVKGGAKVVYGIVEPLIRTVHAARKQYQKALTEQMPPMNQLSVT